VPVFDCPMRLKLTLTLGGLAAVACTIAPQSTHAEEALSPAKRLEPVGDTNPTHVTKRLVREVATRRWKLGRFLDSDRGVYIYLDNSHTEEDRVIRKGELLCGSELAAAHKRILSFFYAIYLRDDMDGLLSCSNRNRVHECHAPANSEWTADIALRFVPSSRGLLLESIFSVNGVYTSKRDAQKNLRRAEAQRRKARATGCPSTGGGVLKSPAARAVGDGAAD